MTTQLLQDALAGRTRLAPLTVEQYRRIVASGALDGVPIELLDGMLVLKDRSAMGADDVGISPEHQTVVELIQELSQAVRAFGSHVRTQGPITLPPDQEPEPDGAIVRGDVRAYRDAHPGPGDVFCVIEAAHSSLRADRSNKLRIYASHGIPQYLIVNIPDRVVEVHDDPVPDDGTYARSVRAVGDDVLHLRVSDDARIEIAAEDLLP